MGRKVNKLCIKTILQREQGASEIVKDASNLIDLEKVC